MAFQFDRNFNEKDSRYADKQDWKLIVMTKFPFKYLHDRSFGAQSAGEQVIMKTAEV